MADTTASTSAAPPLRWGFVGTGMIANWMAAVVASTPGAVLAAVASRNAGTAEDFAEKHSAAEAVDSWQALIASEAVDAVYVATPTAMREEIGVAAARAGKHVLGEKPFMSLPSLRRITAACRENDVAFMDATHFVHHPRTAAVREAIANDLGEVLSIDSAFLIGLPDRGNIRYDTTLEPMGAIGDLGWYNMRALVEYLPPAAELRETCTAIRRDAGTDAVVAGAGLLVFTNGITSSWGASFESGTDVIELRIAGKGGAIDVDRFLGQDPDGSAGYRYRHGGGPDAAMDAVRIASGMSSPALMFQAFAAAAGDPSRREAWISAAERTQELLDVVWTQAGQNGPAP